METSLSITSSSRMGSIEKKCRVCYRTAYSFNYGVMTCDACKMFFRRCVIEKLAYICKYDNSCFSGFTKESDRFPKCKACRYQKCIDLGMTFLRREERILELKNHKDEWMNNIIRKLLYRNSQRMRTMMLCFTSKNPSLEDMVKRDDLEVYVKTPKEILDTSDWSFFGLYTTVDFLLELDFMMDLSTDDQMLLLRNSATKCSLLSGAMRNFGAKQDRMITADGQEFYPGHMRRLLNFNDDSFLNRIESFVINKLIELNVTIEEFVLITVITFCNPVLLCDPEKSDLQNIVATEQQKHVSALFQFCSMKYQKQGPTRFVELLSLCPALQKNFEDLQYLTMLLRLAIKGTPIKLKNIVEELI